MSIAFLSSFIFAYLLLLQISELIFCHVFLMLLLLCINSSLKYVFLAGRMTEVSLLR